MKSKILMTVDNGASLTKSFYRYEIGDSPPVTGMKKMCAVTRQLTEEFYSDLAGQYSDNSSLVKFGDQYWAVGDVAQTETFAVQVRKRKIQDAIARCLVMVGGVCLEMMDLGATEIELRLGTFLPLDEWGDAEELKSSLMDKLWKFTFNGRQIETVLGDDLMVCPEGYGVATLIPNSTKVNGVLIMGHRDITWAHHEKGAIVPSKSQTFAGWGMHQVIENTRFTFKDELLAARAIFAYCSSKKDKFLLKLAGEDEIPLLKQKIEKAIAQTWIDLNARLANTSMMDAETVRSSGGTSYLWRNELKGLLGSRLKGTSQTFKEMKGVFPDCNPIDCHRMADNYLFWRALS